MNLERRHFGSRRCGGGNFGRVRNASSKAQCKRSILTPNRVFFIFPILDGTAKLFGRDHGVRQSTLREEKPVRSEDLREELQGNSDGSQPTEQKMTLKPAMTLVNGRGFHLSSSRRTSSSAVRAQRRIILNPTEVH